MSTVDTHDTHLRMVSHASEQKMKDALAIATYLELDAKGKRAVNELINSEMCRLIDDVANMQRAWMEVGFNGQAS